jgi:hypothetical protein
MVIVQIRGGLGNQMFQYAAGRALAEARGEPLKMDLSRIARDPLRQYALGCFRLPQEFATRRDLWSAARMGVGSRADAAIRKGFHTLGSAPRGYLRERNEFVHDSALLAVDAPNILLVGYWQNERYFCTIRERIRDDFTVRTQPDEANASMLALIRSTESVALHVRRGDYVSDPQTRQAHGLCTLQYYQGAIDVLAERIQDPHFYVFSDDIAWARASIPIEHPVTWVDHNSPEKPWEDLRLLSACKHAIIANSSFSWWGAWLIGNAEKVVVAPQRWLTDPSRNTSDLLPANWLRLDADGKLVP